MDRAVVQLERVLVVGGGLAGLAAGISLREAGFAVEVVEARAVWPAEGAAITLHANRGTCPSSSRVGEGLDVASAPVPRRRFHNTGGELLCVTDLDSLWHGVDRCLGITRADLQRLLVQQAATVPCRLGSAVTTLNARSGVVEVGFQQPNVWPL
jgi:FAD-dependent urate hydroxylase